MIVIRNARVLRGAGVERTSVVIDGATVQSVGDDPAVNGARVIDADGAWLGPGLVDLHVHFRDPGQTWKEDLDSGARAAAAGGFTAVVVMANTEPPVDRGDRASSAIERAGSIETLDLVVAGALTKDRSGTEMADFDAMYQAGVRLFSDDGDAVPEAGLLRRIMSNLRDLPGAVIAEHAEDRSLADGGQINEGIMSDRHGIVGIPGAAEEVIVARDLVLAAATGARLHIQHVSTAASLRLIRKARESGTPVTCEVTPHHVALDEGALADLDPNLKMYPPLRAAADRATLAEALRQGLVEAVATDHAPHTAEEKSVPFEEAPRGVIGLETAAPVVCQVLGEDQGAFFDRMSVAPARIAGLERQGIAVEPGSPANLMLFDPKLDGPVGPFASKSANSPFTGEEMTGRVMATIYEGRITFEGGRG